MYIHLCVYLIVIDTLGVVNVNKSNLKLQIDQLD